MSGQPADPFKQQNEADPPLSEKHNDFAQFVQRCKFCMMTTKSPDGPLASRCMALAGKENNDVDFIFHTNNEAGKTDDLKASPDINLGFLNNAGEWASVSGKASIVDDQDEVKKWYNPILKMWLGDLGDGVHDGGPDDPRIALIKISAETLVYNISGKGIVGQVLETVQGALGSQPPARNKLVHLSHDDLQKIRSGQS